MNMSSAVGEATLQLYSSLAKLPLDYPFDNGASYTTNYQEKVTSYTEASYTLSNWGKAVRRTS